ncbi:MAG: TlpA family protein disulfide reductase [Nitrospinota bacterium]|nr:MAG: TlpA family protein disulfide reductase [Nitrospinota bacterium]
MRRWVKSLLLLSLLPLLGLLGLFAARLGKDPKLIPSPLVGKPAPPFTLQLFNGETLRLQDLRGKVVVLNFWASWCYPSCWNEAPRLEAAWQRYRDQGVVIVGVNYQDKDEDARQFIARFGKTFPNGPDHGSKISIDYGVYGVPETFFIDRQGIIAHKHIGEISLETLTTQIEALLAPKPVQTSQRKEGA